MVLIYRTTFLKVARMNKLLENLKILSVRNYSQDNCRPNSGGLILGVYYTEKEGVTLTKSAERFNEKVGGKVMHLLTLTRSLPKLGDYRVFFGVDSFFYAIVLVGLGSPCLGYNEREQMDERKEAIRLGIGAGVRAMQKFGVPKVLVDSCGHAESAAEGASMGTWLYQELRDIRDPSRIGVPLVDLFDSCDFAGWQIGLHKASAQNLARHLMETPGNLLTPSAFAQSAVEILSKHGINVEVRMHQWAKLRCMNAFLAVGMGSCEQPVFLEMLYEGCDPNICPIVLIGKGVTFDAGGLCLKKCKEMKHMRGDVAGAAAVVCALRAAAALQLPMNIRGLVPLCVNTPGATALKPGDTVKAMNGKTIIVQNTDHSEGLLMLADTLSYAKSFNPKCILDIGTLTPGAQSAMGTAASIAFSNSESLYDSLRIASIHSGDRIWRFPLWNYFKDYVRNTKTADLTNLAVPQSGGEPGRAAAFLREFVPEGKDWIHLDSYNLTRTSGKVYTYLRRGMAGRPTRTIIEFLAQLCCNHPEKEKERCLNAK